MSISFSGKRALVTGSAQGIGREVAEQLVKLGAEVIGIDVKSPKGSTKGIKTLKADLSSWTQTTDVMKKVGSVDLLVNNAGVALLEPITKLTQETTMKTLNVNLIALMHITQVVVADMLKKKIKGSIVNLSSIAGFMALNGCSIYCSSKGAVNAYTRACALELGPAGIRVNSVNPTLILTDMGKAVISKENLGDFFIKRHSLKRYPGVNEVGDAIIHLLSDRSSSTTGWHLPIDAGILTF